MTLTLQPIPPFRLDYTVWALRRRERNLIDRWDGVTYRRVVVVEGRATELAIRQSDSKRDARLLLVATPPPRTSSQTRHLRSVVDRLLGLQIDLTEWYRIAEEDVRLGDLARRFNGMKPPRFETVFEALVNGFACQQLSLEVGLELLNRLATISGAKFGEGAGVETRDSFCNAVARARLPDACAGDGPFLAFIAIITGGGMSRSDTDNPSQQPVGKPPALDDLLSRVTGEYREMPGMCVTRQQAQRLWGLDPTTCELVLTTLVDRGVVRQTSGGKYIKC